MVLRIRSADERERAAESVNDLLIVPMLTIDAVGAPGPDRRQLPFPKVVRQSKRVGIRLGERPQAGLCDQPRQLVARGCHIFDSDRRSSAACANSWTRLTSGRTVTSTRRTASSPRFGAEEFRDGTCSVTENTRHIVLGREGSPMVSSVSS